MTYGRWIGTIAILLMLFCMATITQAEGESTKETEKSEEWVISPRTQVVMLGTGTPNANPFRSGPCVAIVVDNTPYIVDFGPGVVRRASAAFYSGIPGLEVSKLSRAFLTHLHSDHTAADHYDLGSLGKGRL